MLTIARNASEATGESVDYMFSSLVVGIARKSKLILDNLGIIIDAEDAYIAYAKKVGKTATTLTANEQQLAFMEAAFAAASRQAGILGEATDNVSLIMQRARASFKNAKDELSKAFVPVAKIAAKAITWLAEGFQKIPKPVLQLVASLLAIVAAIGAIVGPVMVVVGLWPMLTGLFGAISGLLPALLPIVAVLAAIAAVITLLRAAWVNNWGGIRTAVEKFIKDVWPYVQSIVNQIRTWVGYIKVQLMSLGQAIRNLLEPAFRWLAQALADGSGFKTFLLFLKDAVTVVLSTVLKLIQAITLLLEGRADEAWKPLADAGINVITLIVIAWRKYISKAVVWGWNLVVNLANGIISAARTVLQQAATFVGNMLAGFFAGHSPPAKGPLAGIVQWGKGLIDTYLRAFGLADFGILKDVLSPVKAALQSAVELGDIDQEAMLGTFRDVRTQVAALLASFRETGQVSEEMLAGITARLGEGGEEYTKYLRLTLEHQQALENLKGVEKEVADAEAKGFVPADLKAKLAAAQAEADSKKDAVDWQREYLDALQEGVDLQVEMIAAMKDLTEAMKGVGAGIAVEGAVPFATPGALEAPKVTFGGFGGFSAEFEGVKQEVKDFFEGLPERLRTTLLMLGAILAAKFLEIREKVSLTLLMIGAILAAKFLEIREKVRETLLMIAAILLAKLLEARAWIVEKLIDIKAFIIGVLITIATSTIPTYVLKILTYIAEKLAELYANISDKLTEIRTWIEESVSGMKDWVGGQVQAFIQIGRDILQGLWDGMIQKWNKVKDWFQGAIGDIPDWAKKILGIGSPSRVFMEIGEMAAAGLQAGFGSAIQGLVANANLSLAGAGAGGPRVRGDGGPQVIVIQIPNLSLPGVRDGRDAGGLIEQLLQSSADQAGLRSLVPGGIMG
jgi:hypothetical protein